MVMKGASLTEVAVPRLPGFELKEILGRGAYSVVYRAARDGSTFAVKILRNVKAGEEAEATLRFRREAAALARVNHPGVVKVVEVNESDGSPFLVMELVEGGTLAEMLRRGPLSEADIVRLGRSIAGGLAEIHRRGLVHRDIKPANILVRPSGEASIIDFGFVADAKTTADAERQAVGTFLYSAPEQTGILRRPVDGRADLYALGAVLFECAAGRPPFQAESVSELLRMHLAVAPPNVRELNPAMGEVFAEIIAKLLSKDPDDRYRTGGGLADDLQHLADLEAARRAGKPVELATKDSTVRITDVPLVGRAVEVHKLRSLWQRVKQGHGGMVQVEGESGSGKTRLVRELLETARGEGAVVLFGKAQMFERLPFGPLREAVEEHASRLLRAPEEENARALFAIRKAAGEFAPVIRRLSPSLQRLLGDSSDIRPLDPAAEQLRFYEKIAEFFAALPRELGPAILLVDDVQWLDDGTLEVMKRLSPLLETTPLLVATTARNDPKSGPARDKFVAAMGNAIVERFSLEPLSVEAVAELVAVHLGGKRLDPSVVERIAAQSNGNPLFVAEYVRTLAENGMLRPTAAGWVVDAARFHKMTLPTDVLELLVGRLAAISPAAASVLSCAAVIGFEVQSDVLQGVAGALSMEKSLVQNAIEESLQSNLIEPSIVGYRFFHDRVHEALLKQLSGENERDLNQAVAEYLDAHDDGSQNRVFALARHYAKGDAEKHRARVFETSFDAGVKALETFSNDAAFEHLERAVNVARDLGITGEKLNLAREHFGVACTRAGRAEQAYEQFQAALAETTDAVDVARLRYLHGYAHSTAGKHAQAWDEFQQALATLGAALPTGKILQRLSVWWHLTAYLILFATGFGFGKASGKARAKREAVARIYEASRLIGYMVGQPFLTAQILTRELHNGIYLGASPRFAKALVYYSFGVLSLRGDHMMRSVERYSRLGLSMANQLGDPEAIAYCEYYAALADEIVGKVDEARRRYLETVPQAAKHCPPQDLSALIVCIIGAPFFQGQSRDSIEQNLAHRSLLDRAGSINFQALTRAQLYSQYTLLGNFSDALREKEEGDRLAALIPSTKHARVNMLGNEMMVLLDQEEFGPELDERIDEFQKLDPRDYHRRYVFVLIGYARLEQYRRAESEEKKRQGLETLRVAIKIAKERALSNLHRCHVFVLEGALAREKGLDRRARRFFARAQEQAEAASSYWGLWALARERARLASHVGDTANARAQAQVALEIAKRQGWRNRAAQIRREFGLDAVHEGKAQRSALVSPARATDRSVTILEKERYVDSILRVSLASASTLQPIEQARAALDELVKVLGAERAALFEVDEGSQLNLLAARDAHGGDLPNLTGYSRTVVARVQETRAPLVVTGTDEGEALGSESAVAHNLRSIVAAPLILNNKLLGVAYLDSRVVKGLFDQEDVTLLAAVCNHVALAMETARTARLDAQRQALEKDLALTAAVQAFFLPRELGFKTGPFELRGYYRPASTCGGDWWWYDTSGAACNVLVGDVTGHGAAPAMLSASVASFYRALRRVYRDRPTGELLEDLHTALRDVAGGTYHMTLSALTVDEHDGGRARWWNAGAPPILSLLPNGAVDVKLRPGSPIGVAGDWTLGFVEWKLRSQERTLIFTDGIIEQENARGRAIGLKKLSAILAKTRGMTLDCAAQYIADQLKEVQGNKPLADDHTFVLIDFQ